MPNPLVDNEGSPCTDYEYEKHVNLSIQWNRWLLKPIGLWPNSRTTWASKNFYRLVNMVCYFLMSFLFVPCSLYVIFEVEDLYDKLKLFGPLIFCIMAFVKYCSLIVHEADIRECVRRIEWDWKNIRYPEDRDIMIMNANFGRRLVLLCNFFMYSGFTFYFIAIPISIGRIPMEDQNFTYIPLAYPFPKYIIDTYHSPTNEIVCSIQWFGGILINVLTSASCSLAAAFAVHACGQMQVLMNWLDYLIDGRSDMSKSVHGRINNIVRQHVRILKFLALTKRTIQQISFVEFLGCTLDICLVGYYVIMCRKVGEMCYLIEWFRLPGKTKLCCVLIIAMANSSIKLTAGNMVALSIGTFTDVVKTAVAFLNVLRTTT